VMSGQTTCAAIVGACLDRIEAYDRRGPSLRALLTVNPRAAEEARAWDRRRQTGEPLPPLHGIPLILKDNFDTADLPTTGGARALAGVVPPTDAFVVTRLREAGAIVLAKANMTELAYGGSSVSSLGGQTRNPYDPTRTPGGSSGGTGAAMAASFAVLGTGSDTGQSIRSPASACALIGVRPTRGLISRRGVMPYSPTQDEVGPITRTVPDAARMLDAMAGHDPEDPITARGVGRRPVSYLDGLRPDALTGARLGLLPALMGAGAVHAPVNDVVRAATSRLAALGATIVRVDIPDLHALTDGLSLMSFEFADALAAYLARVDRAPVRTLAELVATGQCHPSLGAGLETDARAAGRARAAEYAGQIARRDRLREAVLGALEAGRLDALIYPHQRRLVVPVGEEQVERNGVLSNSTGLPAVTFPAGFSAPLPDAPLGVPVGLELLGRDWSEPSLLALAYAWERHRAPRRVPLDTPPLG
jgi:amidase